ncbi:GrpB family protein [Hyphomicrobium sp.]|uniref:GrpB family protein n=1 Tax=Hyphomicrobium sp. TaxID=82 RepID=UPI0025B8459F|nr:GrpB family protein [Hyphomicrobium sp.]MCC7252258.1 GrpB family protein [Hyphomicrobium sp.]
MVRSDLPPEPDFSLHPDQVQARALVERLFEQVAAELRVLLPASADIRHVGATAVAGCVTKGDLDIVVRVPSEAFVTVDDALAARFPRNIGSKRTDAFSSFEDATTTPHLGIQLTIAGGEDDYFHLFADALRQDPGLVAQYNALKREFDGKPMEVYRAAKSAFVRDVLSRLGR